MHTACTYEYAYMYPSIVCTINMHVYTFTASHISSMYNVPCTNVGNNSMLSNHHILLVQLRLNPPSNRFNPCDLVTAKSPFGAFSESKLWLNSCIWQHLQLFGCHFDHLIQQFQGNTSSLCPKTGPCLYFWGLGPSNQLPGNQSTHLLLRIGESSTM